MRLGGGERLPNRIAGDDHGFGVRKSSHRAPVSARDCNKNVIAPCPYSARGAGEGVSRLRRVDVARLGFARLMPRMYQDKITPEMTPVERLQGNVLARGERRLLNWLCERLPAFATPDKMTALGFFGAVLIGLGYVLSAWDRNWLWLSVAAYFINWFGDSLDGSLARFRKIERPDYGYFLDHSVDALAIIFIVGGLGFTPYIEFEIAAVPLLGYLLLAIHTFISAKVMGEFQLAHAGAGPTELRIMLIVLTIAMWALGPVQVGIGTFTIFDAFAFGIGLILIGLYIRSTWTVALRLRKKYQ